MPLTYGWFRTGPVPIEDEHDHDGEDCTEHDVEAGVCCPCCSGWADPESTLVR